MMPRVSPAPLSAWMLVGFTNATAQPAAMRVLSDAACGPSAGKVGGRKLNMISVGMRRACLGGLISVTGKVTSMSGAALLSTRAVSVVMRTGRPPTVESVTGELLQLTPGRTFGTRPSTSRSNPSMISGRRCMRQAFAVSTRLPLLSRSGSGQSG